LENPVMSFTGPDGANFDSYNLSPLPTLAAGAKATFYVSLKTGLNAGTYAVTGASTPTNVMISANQVGKTAVLSGRDALVQQIVTKSPSSGGEGLVTGNPAPSNTWINNSTILLTPSATNSSDNVETWRYAVVGTNVRPAPTASDWTSGTGSTPGTYSVPSGIDGDYYIFWDMETTNYTGITGQVNNGSGVVNYLIDNIAPTVTAITPDRTTTNATPFNVDVTFSEGVGTIDQTRFNVSNATVTGATPQGAADANGLYTTYRVTVTPNGGLADGAIINFSVGAGAAKDKATNNNVASASSMTVNITFNSVRPIPVLTTPNMMVNTDFVVTMVFSKPITGLLDTHISVINGGVLPSSLSGSGTTYTFTVNTTTSVSGTPIVVTMMPNMVQDAAGNDNVQGDLTVAFSNIQLAAVLSYSGPLYTNAPFNVNVTFTEDVTGLLASHFTWLNPGDFSSVAISGSGKNWILKFTPISGREGSTDVVMNTVTTATDAYGNTVSGSNTVTINYDTRRPLANAYITTPVAEVNFDPFDVTIVFDEAGVTSFDMSRLESNILEFLTVVNGPVTIGTTTEWTVRVRVKADSPSGSQVGVKVNEGTVIDKAANPNAATAMIYLTDWSGTGTPGTGPPVIFIDNIAPYVVSMLPGGNWAPIKGNLIITFNKTIDQNRMGKVWLEDFGYLTGGTWIDNKTLSFPYGYLKYYKTYQVYVTDFYDLAGNLQDPPFNGAFSTGMPIRPTIQREIMLFAGTGVSLSLTPNVLHYMISSQDFTFTVTAKPGYNLDNLKVTTGIDLRDREGISLTQNADGSVMVTIKNVTEHLFVTVTIGALANETLETVKVWAYDHSLNVQTDQLATLRIYTMSGQLFRNMPIPEGLTTIPLPRGIYTVLVDSKVFKVAIQ